MTASGIIKFLLKELEPNRKQKTVNRKKGFSNNHFIFNDKSGFTTNINRQSLYLKLFLVESKLKSIGFKGLNFDKYPSRQTGFFSLYRLILL